MLFHIKRYRVRKGATPWLVVHFLGRWLLLFELLECRLGVSKFPAQLGQVTLAGVSLLLIILDLNPEQTQVFCLLPVLRRLTTARVSVSQEMRS